MQQSYKKNELYGRGPPLANNGPAIWGVCVGLRMEVVTTSYL